MKGVICVATHTRTIQLEKCLERIIIARKGRNIPLVVIHQNGSREVKEILSKFQDEIQLLVHTEAQGKNALENINLNALLYRDIAFFWLNADWCLGVEDDVQISSDSIDFIHEIHNRYKENKYFRGVNLGSRSPHDYQRIGEFTKSRYGMHGQASMITKKTWSHFNQTQLRKKVGLMGLDAMMERYLKLGFMCVPYVSRFLDTGWSGTHTSDNPEDPYFVDLRNSFGSGNYQGTIEYFESKFEPNWRDDCTRFTIAYRWPLYLKDLFGHFKYLLKNKLNYF
jgi:hypothetical protein